MLKTMRERTSVRSYQPGGIPAAKRKTLEAVLQELKTGPFGRPLRLELLDIAGGENLKDYGTYGMIKGMDVYLAGAVESGTGDAEDFGYCMEKAVLEATRLGLGTVWLGGMLSRSKFADKMKLKDNEVIPAVTPVGVPTEKRSLTDRMMRSLAGSKARKPLSELFFEGAGISPLTEQSAGKDLVVFEAVQWAPSASNKQPWRIVREGLQYHLWLDEDKSYNTRFKGVRLQGLDMGIAMAHLELAMKALERPGHWQIRQPATGGRESWVYTATWVAER